MSTVSIQMNPHVIIAVAPFKYKNTYDFFRRADSLDNDQLMETVGILQIQDMAISASVSSSKSSTSGTFSGVFKDVDEHIMEQVAPDDWIFVWFTDNEEDAKEVSNNLKAGKPANEIHSGLKFVGRVESVRKGLLRDTKGLATKTAALTAISFSELETPVYYNPLMTKANAALAIASSAERYDGNIPPTGPTDKLFTITKDRRDSRFAHINDLLPVAIQLYLGGGPDPLSELAHEWNPNDAYLVPQTVGSVLGIKPPEKGFLSYADILSVLIGIQEYPQTKALDIKDIEDVKQRHGIFVPKLDTAKSVGNVHHTTQGVIGVFNPIVSAWAGTPFIQIMQGYLNPTLNETYTVLRPNEEGRLLPQLVVRQKPFTTDGYGDGPNQVYSTPFSSLPRWKADDSMILSLNVGRSRTMNFNYCEVQPVMNAGGIATQMAAAAGIASFNSAGSRRTGLRPFITTVVAGMDEIGTALTPGKSWEQKTEPASLPTVKVEEDLEARGEDVRISSGFGVRTLRGQTKMHKGVDLAMPVGTQISAYQDGKVIRAGWENPANHKQGYGLRIILEHDAGYTTVYGHLDEVYVKVGDSVEEGQFIGESGNTGASTGPHLHFEVRKDGQPYDPTIFTSFKVIYGNMVDRLSFEEPSRAFDGDSRIGNQWSELVSDMLFGGHLKFTGQATLMGIQAPIAVGDNIEIDNCVYHIEQIQHSWQLNPSTKDKTFRTSLSLTNGMSNKPGRVSFPQVDKELEYGHPDDIRRLHELRSREGDVNV